MTFGPISTSNSLFHHLNYIDSKSQGGLSAALGPYVQFARKNLFIYTSGFSELFWRKALLVASLFSSQGLPVLFLGEGTLAHTKFFLRLIYAAAAYLNPSFPLAFLMEFWESPLQPAFLRKWTAGYFTNYDAVLNGIQKRAYRWVKGRGYDLKQLDLWLTPQYFPSFFILPGTSNSQSATKEAASFAVPSATLFYPNLSPENVTYPLLGQPASLNSLLVSRLFFNAYAVGLRTFLARV